MSEARPYRRRGALSRALGVRQRSWPWTLAGVLAGLVVTVALLGGLGAVRSDLRSAENLDLEDEETERRGGVPWRWGQPRRAP